MEQTIWKFPFELADRFTIEMPGNPHILTARLQNGQPCIWALVSPDEPLKSHKFRLLGTGHPITVPLGRYIQTFGQGPFVWHIFESVEEP